MKEIVRPQYHFRISKDGLLSWNVIRLIQLSKELPTIEIPLSEIQELDEEFWYIIGNTRPTCRNIAEHASLINKTDLSYPIILCHEGKVMDGMHRVCKALMQGLGSIQARKFESYIEPDYVGVDPIDLSYD